MERSKVAIIIPSYNEENTISTVINNVIIYGVPIVINDNSTDKTLNILSNIKKKILFHTNKKNLGYEKSLQIGFEIAEKNKFEFVITIDADNQFDHKDIERLITKSQFSDIVVAEREKLQRLGEYIFSFFFNYLFHIKDPLSGLKLYKMKIFQQNNNIFDSKNLIGTELLIKALKKKCKISTIKVKTIKRLDSSRYGSSLQSNIKIMLGIFKVLKIIFEKN